MNPSTALATTIVDELIANGVRDAVLCPGSRNAPLAFALHAADAAGRLRLHVRIDERGAAFLALGLALRSGRPVPVACTSGTAAANLHPAVVEAHHAGVPLLAVTADRPLELRDSGASQTIDQLALFGTAVRWHGTLQSGTAVPADGGARWRAAVCRAVAAATGALDGDPGPAHVNVALTEPLTADAVVDGNATTAATTPATATPATAAPATATVAAGTAPLRGRDGGAPWTRVTSVTTTTPAEALRVGARPLVVAGSGGPAARPSWLRALPRLAEPVSDLWAGSLLPAALTVAERPTDVVVLGRPTLHRPVSRLLADPGVRVTVLTAGPRWTDVAATAERVVHGVPAAVVGGGPDLAWLADVRAADAVAREHAAAVPWPGGLAVARDLVAALPPGALLTVGSSNPIRDVALAATPRDDVTVVSNRGAAGIDGVVSTAIGAALAHQAAGGGPAFALLGDLTFLHDSTGLVIGPDEPRPDLAIVVLNDDGGGIFSLLEQGEPRHAHAFERIFGTPHGADLAALCAATGTRHTVARDAAELADAIERPRGVEVVEVRADRATLRDVHARLRRTGPPRPIDA